LIGPIQIKRKRPNRTVQQLTPPARHLIAPNSVLAEVDFLAMERVRVPHDGGVTDAADPVCPKPFPVPGIRLNNASDRPARGRAWQPLP
jgi:hypothetical protein